MDAEHIWKSLIAVISALAGGTARLLYAAAPRWRDIFADLFVSGFVGVMLLLWANEYNLSTNWVGLLCGLLGCVGPRCLFRLSRPLAAKVGPRVLDILTLYLARMAGVSADDIQKLKEKKPE